MAPAAVEGSVGRPQPPQPSKSGHTRWPPRKPLNLPLKESSQRRILGFRDPELHSVANVRSDNSVGHVVKEHHQAQRQGWMSDSERFQLLHRCCNRTVRPGVARAQAPDPAQYLRDAGGTFVREQIYLSDQRLG